MTQLTTPGHADGSTMTASRRVASSAAGSPATLIAMPSESFTRQFGMHHLARLAGLTAAEPMFVPDLDSPESVDRLGDVEVLLTSWGSPRLDEERLRRMPNLRVMLHCAGSVKGLVSDDFWARGIRASSAADANAVPVAEFTLAAIIFAGKKAPFLARVADSAADADDVHRFGERSNLNRVIGIVGFSRVGRKVAEAVRQLDGVRCLVADPYADPREVAAAGAELVALADMLPAVDVLSLHAPALPSTHHMIGATELAALRDHATLVNTARGALVDTAALERECATGRLNAILDVSDPEPLPRDSALLAMPNVMLTPHIAGSLDSEIHRLTDTALDELERYARGERLRHEVFRADLPLTA